MPRKMGQKIDIGREIASGLQLWNGTTVGPSMDVRSKPKSASQANLMLSVQITVQNQSTASITPNFVVAMVNPGVIMLSQTKGTMLQLGVISKSDVIDAKSAAGLTMEDAVDTKGGSFFSNFKDKINTVSKYVTPSNIHAAADALGKVAGVANALGLKTGGALLGETRRGSGLKARLCAA